MNPFTGALLALFLYVGTVSALTWKSSDYNCQVDLPDGEPITGGGRWSPVGSTEEGTLVGATRVDGSAFVFLGYVNISKRPKFHLNEKKQLTNLRRDFLGRASDFAVQ